MQAAFPQTAHFLMHAVTHPPIPPPHAAPAFQRLTGEATAQEEQPPRAAYVRHVAQAYKYTCNRSLLSLAKGSSPERAVQTCSGGRYGHDLSPALRKSPKA